MSSSSSFLSFLIGLSVHERGPLRKLATHMHFTMSLGFSVQGSGFRVQGLRFYGLGFRVLQPHTLSPWACGGPRVGGALPRWLPRVPQRRVSLSACGARRVCFRWVWVMFHTRFCFELLGLRLGISPHDVALPNCKAPRGCLDREELRHVQAYQRSPLSPHIDRGSNSLWSLWSSRRSQEKDVRPWRIFTAHGPAARHPARLLGLRVGGQRRARYLAEAVYRAAFETALGSRKRGGRRGRWRGAQRHQDGERSVYRAYEVSLAQGRAVNPFERPGGCVALTFAVYPQ